jgi:hypothetical protein
MKWIQIDAQDDPGQTFAADIPGGVLIRTIGPSTSSALTFLPGTTADAVSATPPPPGSTTVDPNTLDPHARAVWDRIANESPEVTKLTPEHFDLVLLAVDAATL